MELIVIPQVVMGEVVVAQVIHQLLLLVTKVHTLLWKVLQGGLVMVAAEVAVEVLDLRDKIRLVVLMVGMEKTIF
jgi:hypothetical protein